MERDYLVDSVLNCLTLLRAGFNRGQEAGEDKEEHDEDDPDKHPSPAHCGPMRNLPFGRNFRNGWKVCGQCFSLRQRWARNVIMLVAQTTCLRGYMEPPLPMSVLAAVSNKPGNAHDLTLYPQAGNVKALIGMFEGRGMHPQ